MTPRDIPNIISVLRILLVIPIMVLLAREQYLPVLLLFAVAGLSDGLDGYLARRFLWQSRLGAMLDPLGDKILLVGAYLALGGNGLLPWWLVTLVMLRDVLIISGALAYRRLCGELTMEPSMISKLNTVLQIALGLLAIVMGIGWAPVAGLLPAMIALVALSTLWSGIDYVWRWSVRAYHCRAEER